MNISKVNLCTVIAAGFCSMALASSKYELTIYNTTQMPLSPPVIYTISGTEAAARVGSAPTKGFIEICQTGNNSTRISELSTNSNIAFVTHANGPILPGESQTFEVEVNNINLESIHFETMYGKTKDVCGIGSVNSRDLVALKQHTTSEIIQNDKALLTGAFSAPALPAKVSANSSDKICVESMNAVSCLRELSLVAIEPRRITYFAGYLPSLLSFLERKFGTEDLNSLLFLPSGAIQYRLKLKH